MRFQSNTLDSPHRTRSLTLYLSTTFLLLAIFSTCRGNGSQNGWDQVLTVAFVSAASVASAFSGTYRLATPLFVVVLIATASIVLNLAMAQNISPALLRAIWCGSYLIIFFSLTILATDKHLYTLLTIGLALVILASGISSLSQFHSNKPIPDFWLDPEFRTLIRARATGLFDNPNILAGFAALSLPVFLTRAISTRSGMRVIFIVSAIVAGLELVATYSRAGWIAGGVGCSIIALYVMRIYGKSLLRILLPATLVLCVLVYLLLPSVSLRIVHIFSPNQNTYRHRVFMWKTGMDMFLAHPVTGVGMGNYESAFAAYRPRDSIDAFAVVTCVGSAHSDWVQIPAEAGLAGVLVVCLIIGSVLYRAVFLMCRAESQDQIENGVCALAVICAAGIGGWFQSYYSFPSLVFVILIAVAPLFPYLPHQTKGKLSLVFFTGLLGLFLTAISWFLFIAAQSEEAGLDALWEGSIQTANHHFLKSIHYNPWNAEVIGDLGATYVEEAIKEHDIQKKREVLLVAQDKFKRCLELAPLEAKWHCRLADVEELLGNRDEAYRQYLFAIELDYYKASYHLQAGRLSTEMGKLAPAKLHLANAIRLFPLWIDLMKKRHESSTAAANVLVAAQRDAVGRLKAISNK